MVRLRTVGERLPTTWRDDPAASLVANFKYTITNLEIPLSQSLLKASQSSLFCPSCPVSHPSGIPSYLLNTPFLRLPLSSPLLSTQPPSSPLRTATYRHSTLVRITAIRVRSQTSPIETTAATLRRRGGRHRINSIASPRPRSGYQHSLLLSAISYSRTMSSLLALSRCCMASRVSSRASRKSRSRILSSGKR